MSELSIQQPSLLEEFATGLQSVNQNPSLVTMANAKWMGSLLCAIVDAADDQNTSVAELCQTYRNLAKDLLDELALDSSDQRLLNTALQAVQLPATRELKDSGKLTGDWLPSYANAIKALPGYFKVATSPVASSTSLGMTLTNHYAELFSLTNEFSFLHEQCSIVEWAHNLIDKAAKDSAANISPHEERGTTYQNQLNVHRKLFSGAYRAESKQWQDLLNENPDFARLYVNGIPTKGVEIRFDEQAQTIQQLMGFSNTQGITQQR